MDAKEKLIEMIQSAVNGCSRYWASLIADKLLAEGVIVPPCKFGDTIFVIPSKVNCELNILHKMSQNNRVYEQVIEHITIWQSDYMLHTCDGLCAVRSKSYKDTWFLTREEAEKALAERSNPNA